MKYLALAFALAAIPATAIAQAAASWEHGSQNMSSFEGGYEADGGEYAFYSCGSFGTSLMIGIRGNHVSAGNAVIDVDGREVYNGDVSYLSGADLTAVNLEADTASPAPRRDEINKLIRAIASGKEMSLNLPGGKVVSYSLRNSSEIEVCSIED